ncbi:MAG: hypothetical protein MHM6MM_007480 [Cercozoa sp. M6MM]
MGKYAQLVMGPAGSGKSTYCLAMQEHFQASNRVVHVMNLDPAAEQFRYQPSLDIRDLISLDDACEELGLGPNGGLVFCMEYLVQHLEWLDEVVDNYADDYLLIDCPGQIELYSHIPVMRQIARHLTSLGYNVCAVYCVDALFMAEPAKFLGGALACLSAMVSLEVPHVNVMTKCDLIKNEDGEAADDEFLNTSVPEVLSAFRKGSHDERFDALTHAFGDLVRLATNVTTPPLTLTLTVLCVCLCLCLCLCLRLCLCLCLCMCMCIWVCTVGAVQPGGICSS